MNEFYSTSARTIETAGFQKISGITDGKPYCNLPLLKIPYEHYEMYAVEKGLTLPEGYQEAKNIQLGIQEETKTNEDENLDVSARVLELLARKDSESYYKATEIVVEHIKSQVKVFSIADDKTSEIWVYSNEKGIYEPNGISLISKIVREVVRTAYTTTFLNNVIAKIKADCQIKIEEFIAHHYNYIDEIPVLNGLLNVKTKELKAYTSDKIFFSRLPIYYNPKADCPNITKHFKDVLASPDDIEVMYEIFGSMIYKEHFIEMAFIFVGDGRNGKGKSLELMRRFVGAENCCNLPLREMNHQSFEIEDLFGKLANLSGDLSSEELKDTSLFKMMTGRDTIMAKRKYQSAIKFINYAKNVFACNELPRVYDSSKGFWSRWGLLNFPYTFVSQEEYTLTQNKTNLKIMNPNHIELISTPEELSGLLNKALEGLQRLFVAKQYSHTKGSQEIKEYWMRKADSFMAFSQDRLEFNDSFKLLKSELRKEYSKYCKFYNIKNVSDKSMKITLENEYGVIEERVYNRDTGQQEMYWNGCNIKNSLNLARVDRVFREIPSLYKNPTLPNTLSTLSSISTELNQDVDNLTISEVEL